MKSILLLLVFFACSIQLLAQRTVRLRNLWTRPQVHILFQGYHLSFTIKDIDKTLQLLAETGDTSLGQPGSLDTGGNYSAELLPGTRMEYRKELQFMMQNGAGVFLLMAGKARIENRKYKALTAIIADIQPINPGSTNMYVHFYDPRGNKLLFSGKMPRALYNMDLGID